MTEFLPINWDAAIDQLVEDDYVILANCLNIAEWQALASEARALYQQQAFDAAQIGRGAQQNRDPQIRSDYKCWLEPQFAAGGRYLSWMRRLQTALNASLYLGLQEFEAHYAYYPVGSFYKKHVDRHQNSNARVISAVLYLNEAWQSTDGGELALYNSEDQLLRRALPEGGTLVLFRSENMPHEVLPALRERWSIAGWFRSAPAF